MTISGRSPTAASSTFDFGKTSRLCADGMRQVGRSGEVVNGNDAFFRDITGSQFETISPRLHAAEYGGDGLFSRFGVVPGLLYPMLIPCPVAYPVHIWLTTKWRGLTRSKKPVSTSLDGFSPAR